MSHEGEARSCVLARQQLATARFGELALMSPDPAHVLEHAAITATESVDADTAALLVRLPDTTRPAVPVIHDRSSAGPGRSDLTRLGDVMRELDDHPGPHASTDLSEPWVPDEVLRGLGFASFAAVPVSPNGTSLGTLLVASHELQDFGPDLAFLQTLAHLVAAALHRAEYEERIERAALIDPLTELPNRALFRDRLDQALARAVRSTTETAVLSIDLDRFKEVNDALGHRAGDEVLRHLGALLRYHVRASDTVARLGADEFAVISEHLPGPEPALELARRLVQAARDAPLTVRDQFLALDLSIGVAVTSATEDHPGADELLVHANAALHLAKRNGGGRIEVFDREVRAETVERLRVAGDLRSALDERQFEVWYQPELELAVGGALWCEALLRWRHPTRGLLGPGHFIEVAERAGTIVPIGRWVTEQAVAQLAAWKDRRVGAVSVNLSVRQFHDEDFVPFVDSLLTRHVIEPGNLWFEITETAVMADRSRALRFLDRLKELGVGLALDDFGTGYSSLALTQRLPVDALKIDRGFVRDLPNELRNHRIVESIIGLAHSLDLLAIAEGVETSDELALLQDLDCDFAQGYHFARPMTAADFEAWTAEHPLARRAAS